MRFKAALLIVALSLVSSYGETASPDNHKIFKKVTVKGVFTGDKDYSGWVVFILPPSDLNTDSNIPGCLKNEGNAEKFPVSANGKYQITLHNFLAGNYIFLFGTKGAAGDCGFGETSIKIDKEEIDMGSQETDD